MESLAGMTAAGLKDRTRKQYNSTARPPHMTNRLFLALACVLLAVRLPSLVQPMGADQGLYAYAGERIRAGGLPYRDAWDQKPPAIHVTYAAMRAAWPHDSAVPAADLIVAAIVAVLLWELGAATAGRGVGQAAALIFLLLSNPAFARLGGVSVRAQCETFIAAAVTGAFLLLARAGLRGSPQGQDYRTTTDRAAVLKLVAAGMLFGVAFAFKYNAAAYGLAAVFALFLWKRLTPAAVAALAMGFVVPAAALAVWLGRGGALGDLYDATITYNVRYSGETYAGPLHAVIYLLTFPVRHARVDALWLLGGGGCAVLLAASFPTSARTERAPGTPAFTPARTKRAPGTPPRNRDCLLAVAWVAAACLTIAINGSRDLPQYFVQAGPALALAAAWAGATLWSRRRSVNAAAAIVIVIAIAVWRVNDFPKLVENTWHDARYALGRISRADHLARYGDRATRKYSALAVEELGAFMQAHSAADDAVYVFGFSGGAYVRAARFSASRFFWSRPVIVGFNEGTPGYGVSGLLDDLRRTAPLIVALQQHDWFPDVDDSAHFFLTTPALAGWLQAGYELVPGPEGYEVWMRQGHPQ
jgi:hypothetical protein